MAKRNEETQRLVEMVKLEMILEGKRYSPPAADKRYKYRSKYGKKIKPEFGMLLSKMISERKEETPVLGDKIQFRGTPNPSRGDRAFLIKVDHEVVSLLKGER